MLCSSSRDREGAGFPKLISGTHHKRRVWLDHLWGQSRLKEFYKAVNPPGELGQRGQGEDSGSRWELGPATLHQAPDDTEDAVAFSR